MDEAAPQRDESPPEPAPPAEHHDAGPPPVQFSLKTLLAVTAALSLAFAAMGRLSAVWAVALAWFLLLVGGHVAANAMQTRAVDHASARLRRKSGVMTERPQPIDLQQACAPTTRLGSQTRLGLGMAVIVGLGAVTGCVVGTALIFVHNRGELSLPAFMLAAFSSTGIGAFLSFLAGTCAKATSKAFREATTSADPRR